MGQLYVNDMPHRQTRMHMHSFHGHLDVEVSQAVEAMLYCMLHFVLCVTALAYLQPYCPT